MSDAPRLLFAAGGTGGHIFPAMAVADRCRELHPGAQIEFAGTHGRLEEKVVPRAGYPLNYLTISGLDRKLSLKTLMLPARLMLSVAQAVKIIGRLRPQVVICAGAYVSYPVGVAAWMRRVPLVLMESNAYPGLVNRKLAPRATEVHVAFQETVPLMKCRSVFVSGNPVRQAFTIGGADQAAARRHFGLHPDKPTLFVFGGSLGARSINAAMETAAEKFCADGVQVIWQTGTAFQGPQVTGPDMYRATFIHEMETGYAAADLVVARAGATTISELQAIGKPSVLVPLPLATVHQQENAQAMQNAGAAVMIPDKDVAGDLYNTASALLKDSPRLQGMAGAAKQLSIPDAADRIARRVLRLAQGLSGAE